MDKETKDLVDRINVLGSPSKIKQRAESQNIGSHQMALDQSLVKEEILDEALSSISTEYQLTVRLRMELTRRQIALILEILNYQSVNFGVNFGMYLSLEHLSALLIGQKVSALEIKDENERRVSEVATIILQSLGNTNLLIGELKRIPQVISQGLTENKLLVDKRVYGSRFTKWCPENFIQILSVPLSTRFERTKGTSVRYSSYTKGYGESHPSAHYQKTKPSAELDGDSTSADSIRLERISEMLILTQLELRAKFLRKRT